MKDFGQYLQSKRPMRAMPTPGGYQEALTAPKPAEPKPIAQRFAEFQAAREMARRKAKP